MTPPTPPVICIDGPSGAGKGTLARHLADQLGFAYLDSGALYRALALLAQQHKIADSQTAALAALAANLDLQFADDQLCLAGQDRTADLRLETTAAAASRLAAIPQVRAALVARQRAYARPPGLVADGRDMGTAIFPTAPLKIFLSASPEARATRRLQQLANQATPTATLNPTDQSAKVRTLAAAIARRDQRDRQRTASPLRPAPDAEVIDSTNLSIAGVLDQALALWNQRRTARQPAESH